MSDSENRPEYTPVQLPAGPAIRRGNAKIIAETLKKLYIGVSQCFKPTPAKRDAKTADVVDALNQLNANSSKMLYVCAVALTYIADEQARAGIVAEMARKASADGGGDTKDLVDEDTGEVAQALV